MRDCFALLQGAVNGDAAAGVLGWWVDGFLSLCADIRREIRDKLEDMELYNNWADYAEHIQWLDELVT